MCWENSKLNEHSERDTSVITKHTIINHFKIIHHYASQNQTTSTTSRFKSFKTEAKHRKIN